MKIIETWKQYMKKCLFGRNNSRTYYSKILDSLCKIKSFCEHRPTCNDCPFNKKYKGCTFREKGPREW